jgi:branched chain amino acid efflux pump
VTLWILVVSTSVGCYALKILGYLVPARVLQRPQIRQLVELVPVALLGALIVVEAIADGSRFHVDPARLAGFAVGAVAVWRRAPFLIVVVAAALTAGLVRWA